MNYSDLIIEHNRYRLRQSGHPFLLATVAVIVTPAAPQLAAGLAVFVAILLIGRVDTRSMLTAAAVGGSFGVYVLFARGLTNATLGTPIIVGVFVASALAARVDRRVAVDQAMFAFCEIFVYCNTVALVLGLKPSGENRLYLQSTTGIDRFSFALVSSPTQAAAVAGVAVIVALGYTSVKVAVGRRIALGGVGATLIYGANYRFVFATAVVTAAFVLARRRRQRRADSTATGQVRSAPAWVGGVAILIVLMPIWWSGVAGTLSGPVVGVFDEVPGLGTRSRSSSGTDELSTLNGRTDIWSQTFELLGRSDSQTLIVGWGANGGDLEYRDELAGAFDSTFRDIRFISAHNTALEMIRRVGMIGFSLAAFGLSRFLTARRQVSATAFIGAAFLVAVGAVDAILVPAVSAPCALFLLVVIRRQMRPGDGGHSQKSEDQVVEIGLRGIATSKMF